MIVESGNTVGVFVQLLEIQHVSFIEIHFGGHFITEKIPSSLLIPTTNLSSSLSKKYKIISNMTEIIMKKRKKRHI